MWPALSRTWWPSGGAHRHITAIQSNVFLIILSWDLHGSTEIFCEAFTTRGISSVATLTLDMHNPPVVIVGWPSLPEHSYNNITARTIYRLVLCLTTQTIKHAYETEVRAEHIPRLCSRIVGLFHRNWIARRYRTESANNQVCYMTVPSINVCMSHRCNIKPVSEHQLLVIMASVAEPVSLVQPVHRQGRVWIILVAIFVTFFFCYLL